MLPVSLTIYAQNKLCTLQCRISVPSFGTAKHATHVLRLYAAVVHVMRVAKRLARWSPCAKGFVAQLLYLSIQLLNDIALLAVAACLEQR